MAPADGVRRGLDAFERGDFGTAIRAWTQARRAGAPGAVDRAIAEAHFRRTMAATTDGRRAQELHEAIALAPDHALYQHHLGLAYLRQGQHQRALLAFEAATRLDSADDRYRRHLTLAQLGVDGAGAEQDASLPEAMLGDEQSVRAVALMALRENQPSRAVVVLAGLMIRRRWRGSPLPWRSLRPTSFRPRC